MRHSDPRLTTGTYGHLDIDDLRDAVDALAEKKAPDLEKADPFGAYLVPSAEEGRVLSQPPADSSSKLVQKNSGPSWIRTKDQSVMSRQL